MFEEEEPGKPKNWGFTVTIITLIIFLNITVIIVCRILLDSHDENIQYWENSGKVDSFSRYVRDVFLLLLLLLFLLWWIIMSLPRRISGLQRSGDDNCNFRWIANCHRKCFDPSKLFSSAIKTVEDGPVTHKRRKNPFFIFDISNNGDCMMVNEANNEEPYGFVNGTFTNSSEHRSIRSQCSNTKNNPISEDDKMVHYLEFKGQLKRRKTL